MPIPAAPLHAPAPPARNLIRRALAAARSQGPWAACWRHIRPDRLEAAQREAFALLDELSGPDGTISRTMLFACTTGRKEAR